jgi:predicted nucleic acid binding AN1-type Zn finger protein
MQDENKILTTSKHRCSIETCRKRLGLMSFKCSCCEKCFCVHHRTPEDHNCSSDYRQKAIQWHTSKMKEQATTENHNYIKI